MSEPIWDPAPTTLIPGLCNKSCASRRNDAWRGTRTAYGLKHRRSHRAFFPGQFFMVRPVDGVNPLLGRPFAVSSRARKRTTGWARIRLRRRRQADVADAELETGWQGSIWGPLGNGFPPPDADHLMLVAGGIGQTPFLAVAREALDCGLRPSAAGVSRRPRRVTLCYGVRRPNIWRDLEDFALPGLDVRLATDDGTRGHHGFVTELLRSARRRRPARLRLLLRTGADDARDGPALRAGRRRMLALAGEPDGLRLRCVL